jgi:hypothetical protein
MDTESAAYLKSYLTKLSVAFGLILNDVPDHSDDTINTKLIDCLKVDLANESRNRPLGDLVKTLLENQVLKIEAKFAAKESEIVTFGLDLVRVFLESAQPGNQRDMLNKVIHFVANLFADQFTFDGDEFTLDSSVLCSLFELIQLVHNLNSALIKTENSE